MNAHTMYDLRLFSNGNASPLSAVNLHCCAGKLFHSGLPHKSINPIELVMDAVLEIQKRFYKDFPPHPLEAK